MQLCSDIYKRNNAMVSKIYLIRYIYHQIMMHWPSHNTVDKARLGTFVEVINNRIRVKIMSAVLKSV